MKGRSYFHQHQCADVREGDGERWRRDAWPHGFTPHTGPGTLALRLAVGRIP